MLALAGTLNPRPCGRASNSTGTTYEAKRQGWPWGWERGTRCSTLVWGQPKAPESSCAINTAVLLPLAHHQRDQRDL